VLTTVAAHLENRLRAAWMLPENLVAEVKQYVGAAAPNGLAA
jgi:hypothetical protein